MTEPKPDRPPAPSRADARRARQADALRENLHRRKEQQRERAGQGAPDTAKSSNNPD